MQKIERLSTEVIAHIAAGQVADRPVSIVKELVENALDAGAQTVCIKIEAGGKKGIIVTDDGCGMDAGEIKIAIQPHTTSKIETITDLQTISTLGFRGEALASITQVATVTIQSRLPEEVVGVQITIKNGKLTNEKSVGMATGTSIKVENLFDHIPARKKFLRSERSEFQLIMLAVTQLALAFPKVGLQLIHNGQIVIDVLPQQNYIDRCRAIIGKSIEKLFLPVSLTLQEYTIQGFIGSPQAATTVSQTQYLFVNNRPIFSPKLSKIIKRAFKTLLPKGMHPPCVLYITTDPALIDVNIHPQKREVRFKEEELLLRIIFTLITQTLEQANLLFTLTNQTELVVQDSKMDPGTADILRDTTNIWNVKEFYEDEPILQIDNLYLIAKTKSGALVIDQHAAHERILYEQFLQSFIAQKIIEQKLAKPITISLPILESQLLLQYKETFSSLGFEFTSVSATEFIFHRIPALFGTRSITQYLLEVVQDLKEQVAIPELDTETHRTIAYLACRNAIKAGEVLTQSERKNILTKLAETSSKYTCPHGRPVILTITSTDLAKMFYRIPAFRNEK